MRASFEDEDDPALITKKLWSFVKRVGKCCRIPEIISYGGRFRSDSRDRAELFNEFFCDQFSEASLYEVDIDFSNDWEFDIEFDPLHVEGLLRKMNANKAQGPDGIHGHILKNCASALAYPLSLIYIRPRTTQVAYHGSGNQLMLSQYTKKVPRALLKIIVLYP